MGDIEATRSVVTAQAVIAVAVEIQEQRRFSSFIICSVEFVPEGVIGFRGIIRSRKQRFAVTNEFLPFLLQYPVQGDKIGIVVGDERRRVICIEEHRRRACERALSGERLPGASGGCVQ